MKPKLFSLLVILAALFFCSSAFPAGNVFQKNQQASSNQAYISDVIPVFNMLAFYNTDFEIANSYEEADFFGRIHVNGNVFLDARAPGNDAMRFHNEEGVPTITCTGWIFRRAKTGQCSEFTESGYQADGLRFFYYPVSTYSNIIGTNYLYNGSTDGQDSFRVSLTQAHTNSNTDAMKKHDGCLWDPNNANIYNGYGYVFIGDRTPPDDYLRTFSGNNYYIIQSDQLPEMTVNELAPPVTMNPYSFVEDLQSADTADTINYVDSPSNFTEDTNGKVRRLAFTSRAPIVIRDGIVYKRDAPGSALTRVYGQAYPKSSGQQYSDLRWYGHFGGAADAANGNPDRWHFPIKSVTIVDYDISTPNRLVFTDPDGNSWFSRTRMEIALILTHPMSAISTANRTLMLFIQTMGL
jgi:hypothetical protein